MATLAPMTPTSDMPPNQNPVWVQKRIMLANVLSDLRASPFLAALSVAIGALAIALILLALHALALDQASTIANALTQWPIAIWAALFLLCLSTQLPGARRDRLEANTGWLAALPQMPEAMLQWSRWRCFGIAATQSALMLVGLWTIHRHSLSEAPPWALHTGMAIAVPLLCWLLLPLLAKPGVQQSRPKSISPSNRRINRHRLSSPRSVLRHWQWVHYLHHRWSIGARWSLGFFCLLITANAGALEVVVVLLTGTTLIQWHQFWTSSLRVVVEATALTSALPTRPRPFIMQLGWLVLIGAVALPVLVFAVLAALGIGLPAAAMIALVLFAALALHAATVFAWRQRPRFLQLRSMLVLLGWISVARAMPMIAPLTWLALLSWLLHKATKDPR